MLLLVVGLITLFIYQEFHWTFLWVVWVALSIPMLYRLIPNRRIAVGARKHFACSYEPINSAGDARPTHKGAVYCALSWFVITSTALFILHSLNILTAQTVLIFALVYAVIDLIFVLFFCPFRALFMRNHCCTTCRIHNWDFFMKCAPLILFPNVFSISLVILAVAVVLSWEISLCRNPHYFTRETNRNLHCAACKDKLCHLQIRK